MTRNILLTGVGGQGTILAAKMLTIGLLEEGYDVKMSVIARGISVGDELEYADEVTLGRSILNRTPFDGK